MAASLEELLAKEGFRTGKSGMRSRSSFRAEAASRPHIRDQHQRGSPLGPAAVRIKNERTRSDVSRYMSGGELPRSDSSSSRRQRDDLVRRRKVDGISKIEDWKRLSQRGSDDMQAGGVDSFASSEGNEIVEVGLEDDEKFKDIYSDSAYRSERSDRSKRNGEDRYKDRKGKDGKVDNRHSAYSDRNLLKHPVLSENNRQNNKNVELSHETSVRSNKNSKDIPRRKPVNLPPEVSKLALDEVAIHAVISILNGYVKCFVKDEAFRAKLHDNSFSSLNFEEPVQNGSTESKIIANLQQAIETVEKAAEEAANAKDLKKALLQLSMITGLKSNDMKDGYTLAPESSRLSACAHLYISVIYHLQKKDRVSAKHILQVFCDSPFWARTVLLPELWYHLFSPHLSHLKVWYNQEADSLPVTPSKTRKCKLLDKVYNEILDSGTYKFAVYYKDWLTEGVEAPSIPSIHIPSLPVQGVERWGAQDYSSEQGSPSGPVSPHPMVSKKLYDAVIGHSSKPGVYEAEDTAAADNFANGANSSAGSAVEVKQALTDSSEMIQNWVQDIQKHSSEDADDNILPLSDFQDRGLLSASNEEWMLVQASSSPERDLNMETNNFNKLQESARDTQILTSSSHTKYNELTLKRLAKSLFVLQQTDEYIDPTVLSISHSNEPFETGASYEDLDGQYEYFNEGSLFTSIPQDFICPLTGKLFDNPVTLETGQTFEREAIRQWLDKGNKTCPVTGKALEYVAVPVTNFILKRLITGWKLQYCSQLLASASQIVRNYRACESRERDETALLILEVLLTTLSGEQRISNVKHIVSVGGLEFLIRMFEFGDIEEKTRVAALLSTCIDAYTDCRKQIARRIDKHGLLELLQSKQSDSRRNAVHLLIELVCLSRRKYITLFLSGLPSEKIINTMHILLVYLQSSPPEQKPLVSVLLLKLDLMVEPHKYSIYREEAVDAISVALECSLVDDKVREISCRALLILGGQISSSGKLLTESWILKQAGFNRNSKVKSHNDDLLLVSSEDEEDSSEERLRNLSISLLSNGKKSFLETIAKCLSSANLGLVRVCLTTVAWISYALSSLSDAGTELQLSAFTVLIPGLKESLQSGDRIEHKVLASMSLHNFSKIPECRVLLMAISDEISVPVRNLAEVTWTAKELYAMVSGN